MSAKPSSLSTFLGELQRRHVYKVGAMYAVGGWLLVQVVTQVLPIFEVSALVQRIIVLTTIAGFPVALVLAWIFDLTPQGIVRTDAQPVSPGPDAAAVQQQRGLDRKLNYLLGALLLLSIGYLLVGHRLLDREDRAEPAGGDRSIAVLPFENLSDDKTNAYFATGIQDEILTRLARIGALKVISRTSTQHYASSPDNLPEIARQLGVANILEGSVQRAGDSVHINVQLIRAATDEHLWAESYDRRLDNIFGVEGEVAGAIAEALNTRLSGAERKDLGKKPTDNAAAYDAFLRGRARIGASENPAVFRAAADDFGDAVQLDPKFALAWAWLSFTRGFLYFNGVDAATFTADSVRAAADMASQQQPDLLEARLMQGYYRYRVLRDFSGAAQAFRDALAQSPNNGLALAGLGFVERRLGQWDQALIHLERAAELDPRNVGLMTTIGGETLLNMRRYDEARIWLDRALAVEPGDAFGIIYKAFAEQITGRLAEAARILAAVPQAGESPEIAQQRSYQRLLERDNDAVIAEVQPLLTHADSSLDGLGPLMKIYLGFAQLGNGQRAAAQATFEHLIMELKPQVSTRVDDAGFPSLLALAYAGAGQHQTALAQARHAVELYRDDAIRKPLAEATLAQVQAMAGDHAAALAALPDLLVVPNGPTLAQLRYEPFWDSLRDDPAFRKLVGEGPTATAAGSAAGARP